MAFKLEPHPERCHTSATLKFYVLALFYRKMLERLKLKRVFGLGSKKSIPILCLSLEAVLLDFVSPPEKLTKNFDPFLGVR